MTEPGGGRAAAAGGRASYVELHCHSAFSLLDGASQPEDLVSRAAALGYPALALTDHADLGGIVRFDQACTAAGVRGIVGAELVVELGNASQGHVVLLAEDGTGYGNLCTLITRARMDRPRGAPAVPLDVLAAHARGLTVLTGGPRGAVPARLIAGDDDGARRAAAMLHELFGERLAVECWDHGLAEEHALTAALVPIARWLGVPWVVANDVRYATPSGHPVHDVLCALRHQRPLHEMGTRLFPNSEWCLHGARRLYARWRHDQSGLRATLDVAERCAFRFAELRPALPEYPIPSGVTADEYLASLVQAGSAERWGSALDDAHARQIAHELAIIRRRGLAGYFLIVWDIVRFARREGILCQGRGSAANSAVCYCLGITAVDPVRMGLLFERFLSDERSEAPDIDIDFAHRERERVLQYVYDRYGRDHAAMVCEHITWRGPSATRDALRVLGISDASLEAGSAPRTDDDLIATITGGLREIPRHRSIHVGGFVLTAQPLHTVVPIEPASMPGRTVIQWEKDDLEPVSLVKIDLLGLGMLTLLQDCFVHLRATRGISLDLATIPADDPAVYDMLCRADTIGVFQVESRAQQNTLPRLKPRNFYDLVVEVALIRPGPIQGDMVHPYLRRRAGTEQVTYPHPALEPILRRTLGIPLFQEQGMQVAIACAGFTAGESDELRRAMGHKRSRERMSDICQRLVQGMARNGIPEQTALRIYNQINAFADYGFPESHAASFALLVYASAYLKHHYAPEFTCALLNAQPMGFYSPGTIIDDARRHGVTVQPVDIMRSGWDHRLVQPDGDGAHGDGAHGGEPWLLLGMRAIRGLGAVARERLEGALADGAFRSVADLVQRTRLDRRALRLLAGSGALDSLVADRPEAERRRTALWLALEAQHGAAGPLAPMPPRPTTPPLPPLSPMELTEADYRLTALSLNGHPMRHLRTILASNDVRTAQALFAARDGDRVAMAGLVICRQRPPTAKGFAFLTLEDETGCLNVVVTPRRFLHQERLISTAPLLLVRGTLQVESGVVNLRGESFHALHAAVGAEYARGHDYR